MEVPNHQTAILHHFDEYVRFDSRQSAIDPTNIITVETIYARYTIFTMKNGDRLSYANGLLNDVNQHAAVTRADGTKIHYIAGKISRVNGPAIISSNGDRYWVLNNELHRRNGPAVTLANGGSYCYILGLLSCLDDPAVCLPNGDHEWFVNGVRHNYENPNMPTVTSVSGLVMYHKNGVLDRADGPAIEMPNGDEYRYINGKLHADMQFGKRQPAVILATGDKLYYNNGVPCTQ